LNNRNAGRSPTPTPILLVLLSEFVAESSGEIVKWYGFGRGLIGPETRSSMLSKWSILIIGISDRERRCDDGIILFSEDGCRDFADEEGLGVGDFMD
jgi:hypothetical protein